MSVINSNSGAAPNLKPGPQVQFPQVQAFEDPLRFRKTRHHSLGLIGEGADVERGGGRAEDPDD